ncbi:MAG: hypothetical protein Ct9H300mP4_00890 [Gammaproteobacteria bacterium]|nr:MAG: hypothetical protein Ct9H300mP4_00890 [Gammaproteobacteria bacterium]
MAKNTKRVNDPLNKVWKPAISRAKQEVQEMQDSLIMRVVTLNLLLGTGGITQKKIRQNKYDFTEAEVKTLF